MDGPPTCGPPRVYTVRADGLWVRDDGAVDQPPDLVKLVDGATRTHLGLRYPTDGSLVRPLEGWNGGAACDVGALHVTDRKFVDNWANELSSRVHPSSLLVYKVHLPADTRVGGPWQVVGCGRTVACGYAKWTVSQLNLGKGDAYRGTPHGGELCPMHLAMHLEWVYHPSNLRGCIRLRDCGNGGDCAEYGERCGE